MDIVSGWQQLKRSVACLEIDIWALEKQTRACRKIYKPKTFSGKRYVNMNFPQKLFISGVALFTLALQTHTQKGILWNLHSLITDTKFPNRQQDKL